MSEWTAQIGLDGQKSGGSPKNLGDGREWRVGGAYGRNCGKLKSEYDQNALYSWMKISKNKGNILFLKIKIFGKRLKKMSNKAL